MKILIYGFKDYKNWKRNITEPIIKKVKKKKNLKKVIFLQSFNKKQFRDTISSCNPDLIIGVGQHSKGEQIKLERKAYNVKKVNNKAKRLTIIKNASLYYFLNLKIDEKDTWNSYHIYDDLSNYSRYIISHYFKDTAFLFLNFPKKHDIKQAAKFVDKQIELLEKNKPEMLKQKKITRFL